MTPQTQITPLDRITELLAEHGFDGLAQAVTVLLNEVMKIWNATANPPYAMRSPEEIAGYFEGLELVEPGLVDVTRWRPDPSPSGLPPILHNLIGVGRKP